MNVPTISLEEVKSLIESSERYLLIDFREKEEMRFGMIPSAWNVPPSEFVDGFKLDSESFAKRFGFLKPLKNEKIVLYCRTGTRSYYAVKFMMELGFTNVFNFKGSVLEWSEIDPKVKMY